MSHYNLIMKFKVEKHPAVESEISNLEITQQELLKAKALNL